MKTLFRAKVCWLSLKNDTTFDDSEKYEAYEKVSFSSSGVPCRVVPAADPSGAYAVIRLD